MEKQTNQETESNSLIREFKTGMRKEKIIGHLKTHQKRIAYAISAIVLGLIIWMTFCFYNQMQSKKYSAILHQAMIDEQKGNLQKSTAALKEIYESHAPAGVRAIASLKYAAQILASGNQDQAVEIYLNTNKNRNFNSYIREYSGLIALKILVNEDKKENKEKITALITNLEKNSKTLKYHIIEQKGILAWNTANFKEANEAFKSIVSNPEASEILKKRAAEMVAIYNSKFGIESSKLEVKAKKKDEVKSKENLEEKNEEKSAVKN